jgi:hypothetical protein
VGNDPSYSSATTFETFPWPPGHEPKDSPLVEAIAEAARELVEKRDAWLNPPNASAEELKRRTLTNFYNARPSWLVEAHRKLDAAVFAAYGWPDTLTDAEILERLLALNYERAAVWQEWAVAGLQGHSPPLGSYGRGVGWDMRTKTASPATVRQPKRLGFVTGRFASEGPYSVITSLNQFKPNKINKILSKSPNNSLVNK